MVCMLLLTACGGAGKTEVSFSDIENMAENAVFYYGHTTESFLKQIENGHLSDVIYP